MISKTSWNFDAGKNYSIPITAYKIQYWDWYHTSGAHTSLNFKIQNYNSKFKIRNHKLKWKFEIQSKFEMPSQNPKFKIYEHAHSF